jgi:hypothetical protein
MIMREKFPSGAARAVVFADRAPLPLGKIRPPAFPVFFAGTCFLKPLVFFGLESGHRLESLWKQTQSMVASFYVNTLHERAVMAG